MEEWGKPPPAAPRPVRQSVGAGEGGWQPPAPPQIGFGDAFDNLAARKLRELSGAKWADDGSKGATRRREAEAKRRAAAEMARRIERQTGRRPKESTIRRAATAGRTPRGVDPATIDRQARIDAAGGVKAFAAKARVPAARVARWRDSGTSIGGAIQVQAIVDGAMISGRESYPKRNTYAEGDLRPPASDDLLAALGAGDAAAVRELLGPFVAHHADWQGEAQRDFRIESITELIVAGIAVTGLG